MRNLWTDLGLHKWIADQLEEMGIFKPTDVQFNCIPAILSGKDCIGCANTGSGKTAAFALPILQKISEDPYGVCALVLTPTRELATQIADQFTAIGRSINIQLSLVVGGESITLQSIKLSQKPHIVVATPGRLASLLEFNSEYFHFKKLKYLVLDEVDALLVRGDVERDVETILKSLPSPEHRQTLAFSATASNLISSLQNNLKVTCFMYISQPDESCATVKQLSQYYLLCNDIAKEAHLVYILQLKLGLSIESDDSNTFRTICDMKMKSQAIVFAISIWSCHVISKVLVKLGFKCSVLHSGLPQKLRNQYLSQFRSGHTRVLVATSLAGRGLDIPMVDLVVNFSLPYTCDDYIHHVGRTARAGRLGTAITFVAPYELERLAKIEERIAQKLTEYIIEDEREVDKFIKSCALLKKEASTNLFHNSDSKINLKIERNKLYKHKVTKNKKRS